MCKTGTGSNFAFFAKVRACPRFALALVATFCALAQQHPERRTEKLRDAYLSPKLTYTLEDARLSAQERNDILAVIDKATPPTAFPSGHETDRRDWMLGAFVGSVDLAGNGSRQVAVTFEGDRMMCGATGNCMIWVFSLQYGQAKLILEANGWGLTIRPETTHGLRDVAVESHLSAVETALQVFQFNGTRYTEADCYVSQESQPGTAPRIVGCRDPETPRKN